MQQKVFGWSVASGREILSQRMLPMFHLSQVTVIRWILRQGIQLLLCSWLSEKLWNKMCNMQLLCGRWSHLNDGQHLSPKVFHLLQMQATIRIGKQGMTCHTAVNWQSLTRDFSYFSRWQTLEKIFYVKSVSSMVSQGRKCHFKVIVLVRRKQLQLNNWMKLSGKLSARRTSIQTTVLVVDMNWRKDKP